MQRIDTSIETLKSDIGNFYKEDKHHFIVLNAVELGQKIELQWFFTSYEAPHEIIAFCARVSAETEIPSINDIVASAWVSESELADLMNLKIENTRKGFVLEPDSVEGPLRVKK